MLIWSIYQCKNGYIVSDTPIEISNYERVLPKCHIARDISELGTLLITLESKRTGVDVTWTETAQTAGRLVSE